MIEAVVGVPAPLAFMLPDGATTKGVRAYIQKDDGTALGDYPLIHQSRGRYISTFTFPAAGVYFADFITFLTTSFVTEDVLYTRRADVYNVRTVSADLSTAIANVPQQVWAYPTRLFTNDISALATHADVAGIATTLGGLAKTQYVNKMTTAYNTITGLQEVLVWPEKDGAIIVGADCAIAVKDSLGATKWTASTSLPSGDGVYRFSNPIDAQPAQNLYIVIGIKADGLVRTNIQPFFTVG